MVCGRLGTMGQNLANLFTRVNKKFFLIRTRKYKNFIPLSQMLFLSLFYKGFVWDKTIPRLSQPSLNSEYWLILSYIIIHFNIIFFPKLIKILKIFILLLVLIKIKIFLIFLLTIFSINDMIKSR